MVLNCVTLWTTVYLDAAVRQLKAQGYPVRDEDMARLSPPDRIGVIDDRRLGRGRRRLILPDGQQRFVHGDATDKELNLRRPGTRHPPVRVVHQGRTPAQGRQQGP